MSEREAKLTRLQHLSRVFTPSAPVNRRDLFSGRIEEIFKSTSALAQPGQHVLLYGERGVGKTSLANLLTDFLVPLPGEQVTQATRVNLTTKDNFKTIWTKVFRSLGEPIPDEWALGCPDPDEIRHRLEHLHPARLVILDEFDRMEDDDSLSLMADTIKALSDHLVPTKMVIVGVADSIDQLIGEHESIRRAIAEVLMPRMTRAELFHIIDNGLALVGMEISPSARTQIARLAEGLPTYVHRLTLYAAQTAAYDDRDQVATEDVKSAIEETVQSHSLAKEYHTAVQSSRGGTLFSRVLVSCALAKKDRLGYFTAGAVRAPMSRIMGKQYDIPAFATHLKSFTEVDRGSVLKREGPERRYTYRFRDPLLQPFAVLTALSEGLLPDDYVAEIFRTESDDVWG